MNLPSVKEFVKLLQDIDRSKHTDEIFRDFCELVYCALSKPLCQPDKQDEREAQYMAIVARYRDKDSIRKMPQLMAMAMQALMNGGVDYLGAVAGEIGALNSDMGQFFTPYEVCRLMAEITFTNSDAVLEREGFITCQEPALGGGAMVLAAADHIEAKGVELETSLWVDATELSASVFHMGYIQLAMRGVAGIVRHGNSLSNDYFNSDFLPAAKPFLDNHGDPFAKQHAQAEAKAEERAKAEAQHAEEIKQRLLAAPDHPAVQLGLFD